MPLVRLAGNTGLGFLVRLASGYWSVFDPTNGYLALRTDVLRMIQRPLPMRYFFESGLLIELGILRACVQDVPIPARYGEEESSLSVTKSLLGFPPRLAAGLVRRVFWRYYVYDFTTVSVYLLLGIPALFFGTLYGLSVWLHGEASETFAAPGPVMIAAMPIILGFQLLLQAVAADIAATPREPISPPLAR
jgi:hypothetical protein